MKALSRRTVRITSSLCILIVIGLLGLYADQGSVFRSGSLLPYREHEVLITFKNDRAFSDKMAVIVRIGGKEYQELSTGNIIRVITEDRITLDQALDQCRQEPAVEYAQPNYVYKSQAVPDDPEYADQWFGSDTYESNSSGSNHPGAGIERAWDLVRECPDITVAVIDSGINYNHEDLAANMWINTEEGFETHGYDFVDEDSDPMDFNGHGTHVAGIIGAAGNNATGITGLCWTLSLMALRVLDETGRGTTADIIQAVEFAAGHGADIMVMSFGNEIPFDRVFHDVLTRAFKQDIVAVAPAGNGDIEGMGCDNDTERNGRNFYPCSFDHDSLVCVAAIKDVNELAPYSNYGQHSVDIAAPGSALLSTTAGEHVIMYDDLETDWVMSGGWGHDRIDLGFGTYDMLINPEDWDRGTYTDMLDARAYKSFDLSSFDAVTAGFYAFINTEKDRDFLNINISSDRSDPFTQGDNLDTMTGETGDNAYRFIYDLSPYMSENTTLGFQLFTDEEQNSSGIGIFQFEVSGLRLHHHGYTIMDGTSQAAAYVAGIAALIKTYNPDYTASDIIHAVMGGGEKSTFLHDSIKSGRSASVLGSLLYINRPRGVRATVLKD